MVHAARFLSPELQWRCCFSAGSPFISFFFCREVPLAEEQRGPLQNQVPEGIVPQDVVARTERRWLMIMLGALALQMSIIVVTGIAGALRIAIASGPCMKRGAQSPSPPLRQ